MAGEMENALKSVAEKVVKYVEGLAEMRVETRYIRVGSEAADVTKVEADSSPLAASTVIKLDGDSIVVVPMREGTEGQLEIDTALLEFHQRNVAAAMEYRARIASALVSVLQNRLR